MVASGVFSKAVVVVGVGVMAKAGVRDVVARPLI